MNIIESYLSQALNIPPVRLQHELKQQLERSPFGDSLPSQLRDLLTAQTCVIDDLWKFSVALNVPHQHLFDAFNLQTQILPSRRCA